MESETFAVMTLGVVLSLLPATTASGDGANAPGVGVARGNAGVPGRGAEGMITLGMGNAGNDGRIEHFRTAPGQFQHLAWGGLRWEAYNRQNGETRVTTGDVDADGFEETIIGFGPSTVSQSYVGVLEHPSKGGGHMVWMQAPFGSAYSNASGETWVAAGDVDGKPGAEIIVGQGTYPRDGGRYVVFGGKSHGYNVIESGRVPFGAYNARNGAVRPACGDLDGDGKAELIFGHAPDPQRGGSVAITPFGAEEWSWRFVRLPWSEYNAACGGSRPACGDVDGDGRAELAIGIDTYRISGGQIALFRILPTENKLVTWLRVPHADYVLRNGETRPALGDVNGDGKAEVLVALGPCPGNTANVAVFENRPGGFACSAWIGIRWTAYNDVNGEAWAAVARPAPVGVERSAARTR